MTVVVPTPELFALVEKTIKAALWKRVQEENDHSARFVLRLLTDGIAFVEVKEQTS